MTFEAIKCPHCGVAGNLEISAKDSDLKWDYNRTHVCYSKKIYCICMNCETVFSMDELYDVVGYDENSIRVLSSKFGS